MAVSENYLLILLESKGVFTKCHNSTYKQIYVKNQSVTNQNSKLKAQFKSKGFKRPCQMEADQTYAVIYIYI